MKIVWNKQSIRWFQNASAYTGYNRMLAELLLDRIPCRDSLCDIGCGAGLIDFELSPHFREITCVDISPVVTESIEKRARQRDVKNISARCMDAGELSGQWETVIALFHGAESAILKYLALASDRLIWVTHGRKKIDFDMYSVRALLDEASMNYRFSEHALEYGQPFSDIQEAQAFVEAYMSPMNRGELDAYLRQKLQETGGDPYPYYLPNLKKLAIFVIQRDKNQHIL